MLKKILASLLSLVFILFQLNRFVPFNNAPHRKRTSSHPIPQLMVLAQTRYESLLSRQSRTLKDAIREYRKRYGRDPPKGFNDWYSFAKENNVKIIDEYDQLMDDIKPFFDLSGEELRRRALQVF